MRRTLYIPIFIIFLVATFGLPTVWAQMGFDFGTGGDGLSLKATPEIAGPNTNVRLSIESFSTDLSRADIGWEVDGALVKKGLGETNFQTKTGDVGSTRTVKVTAQTKEGGILVENITFRPGLVDIIWQADSWTPPFYKGRGLATPKARIYAQAMPYMFDGKTRIATKNLSYEWFYDFEPMTTASGVGKNTLELEAPDLFGSKNLRVVVSSLNNRIVADNQVNIFPVETLVLVWPNDPLLGIDYGHPTTNDFSLLEDEVNFVAGGIYFPKSHVLSPGLTYKWTVNGKPATTDEGRLNSLTIRKSEGGGEGRVNVDIYDPFDQIISSAKTFLIKAVSNNFQ